MSFLLDQLLLRGMSRKRKVEEQRHQADQTYIKGSEVLPGSIRAQTRRMDMAANRRMDRRLILNRVLIILLIVATSILAALWNARRLHAQLEKNRALRAQPAEEAAREREGNESGSVETDIPWEYPYSPRDGGPPP